MPQGETMNQHNVTVYSTPSCPYCTLTKNYFDKIGVKYTEIDVSADEDAARAMIQKSGQMGVPVIDIDGKMLVGYRPNEFDQLLK